MSYNYRHHTLKYHRLFDKALNCYYMLVQGLKSIVNSISILARCMYVVEMLANEWQYEGLYWLGSLRKRE